jgi:hypothetical protein
MPSSNPQIVHECIFWQLCFFLAMLLKQSEQIKTSAAGLAMPAQGPE